MRVDFPKKKNILVQEQKCEISNDVFSCESGTAEIQVTVYCAKLRNFKSQIVLCVKAELLNFETKYIPCAEVAKLRNFKSQDILCGTARLKVKALVWKRNCETSSHIRFIVWKRNCVTSKEQYFPCVEAELRHFRAPSQTLFCMRKRNFKSQYIPCAEPKNIPCVEAELQNFKSHNSLCAEAELQVT